MTDTESEKLNHLNALRETVNNLVQWVKAQDELALDHARTSVMRRAEFEALHSISVDLAQSLGITPMDFDKHYQARVGYFLEKQILTLGDDEPEAAELLICEDFRDLLSEAAPFPSLFDMPPQNERESKS